MSGTTIRKAGAVGPAVLVGAAVFSVVVSALPTWAELVVGYGALVLTGLGCWARCEPWFVRLVFNARGLNAAEQTAFAPVFAVMAERGMLSPVSDFYVARGAWRPFAVGRGRRSVIVSAEMTEGVVTGDLPVDQAAGLFSHSVAMVRAGHVRMDPVIWLWTGPWRVLALLARPLRGLLGFAWRMRPVVGAIAVYQSFTTGPGVVGVLGAAGITVLLALTYLAPRWARSWDTYVLQRADEAVAKAGLGLELAAFLRRLPRTLLTAERLQTLGTVVSDDPQGPRLRLLPNAPQ